MELKVKYVHTQEVHNLSAPTIVVPYLMEMFNPISVLDVGCGIGTWLKCFTDYGIDDIIGLDGEYVDRAALSTYFNTDKFIPTDLTQPFNLKRKFELVISLEVAEHLPESSAADFISSLVKHGDTIIFSAAIPGQGGQNHLNEQWKKYWIDLFTVHGYRVYDLIRPRIWDIAEVEYWYKQNMIVFSKHNMSSLKISGNTMLDAIHPEMFAAKLEWLTNYNNGLHEEIAALKM